MARGQDYGGHRACHPARAQEYEGKKFKNVAMGDLELPEDEAEKQRLEEQRQAYAGLRTLMQEVLSDVVQGTSTPGCLGEVLHDVVQGMSAPGCLGEG